MENIVKEIESGEELFHFQSVHREKIVYLRSENLLAFNELLRAPRQNSNKNSET